MDKYLSLKGCAHKSIPTGILLSSNPVEQLTIGPDKAVHGAIYFGSPVLSRPSGAELGIAGKMKIVFLLKEEKIKGSDQDMIKKFLEYDHKKIILKRPLKSEIYSNINYQVKGKTTRFDIYL